MRGSSLLKVTSGNVKTHMKCIISLNFELKANIIVYISPVVSYSYVYPLVVTLDKIISARLIIVTQLVKAI